MITEFIQFSLTPILIGILAGISCAVPGNFLILKRQALIGDAISHVVLPGIVIAFIFTGVVSTIPMLLGAAAAADEAWRLDDRMAVGTARGRFGFDRRKEAPRAGRRARPV